MSEDRDRKYRRQWLLTIGILFLLGMVLAYDLYLEHGETESVEHDRLAVQARVIDENLSHQLVATYQSMQRIANDLPYWRVRGSYQPVANIMLKTIEEAMPGVRTLIIIDTKGIARASSRHELIGQDLSQREYFQEVLRHHDPATLYLSAPYTTMLNVYAMNLSRMVTGPKGKFNGIIVATLDPEYFKTLLASVQYAPDMWVAIAHGDGKQFIMVPDRPGQAGKDLARPGSFFSRHRDSGRDENIMTGTVYSTGEERIMALRTIHPAGAHLDKPLVAAVGRDIHALFAEWRRDVTIYSGIFILIILITVFSLRYSQTSVRRADEKTRRSKEALEKSEERYRLLAENTTDVVWQLDLRTRKFTYVSPSVFQLRGYTAEEVIAQPLEASLTPDSLRHVQTWIGQMLEEFSRGRTDPRAELQEVEQPRKDGTTVWTEVATTYVLDRSNQPIGVIGISRDITKRRRAEEKLRETLGLLRTFMNAISESAFLMDKEGRILASNETVAKRFGKTVPDFIGATIDELLPPDVALRRKAHMAEVVLTKKPGRFEDERTGRTIDNSIYPVFNAQGEVGALAVVGYDITERKLAEEAIKQSEKKLRDITASLGEGLYVLNDKEEVTFMNPEAERLLGWTEDELHHKNIHDVIHNRKPDGSPLPFEECSIHHAIKAGGRFFSQNEIFIRKNGAPFPVSVISVPLREEGGAGSSVTVFRDISDIKRAEQEREELITEMQKALAEIKTLHGILPICSNCKKIRDDKGAWTQMEDYISNHTDAEFSHGLCDDCARKLYPKYFKKDV